MSGIRSFWNRWNKLLVVIGAAIWTVVTVLVSALWSAHQLTVNSQQFQERLAFEQQQFQARSTSEQQQFQTRSASEQQQFQTRLAYDQGTRRIESQKPFLEKRLEMYIEFIKVSSSLTQVELLTSDEYWKNNVKRFWQMRWGEIEMVGDAGIRNAARLVGEKIADVEMNKTKNNTVENIEILEDDRHSLRWAVECLADELRYSIEHTWGLEKNLKRESVVGVLLPKLPNGCNQNKEKPIRPRGMP